MLRRMLLAAVLFVAPLLVTACASTQVREQALTGDTPHERHAEGIESQVTDHQ